MAVEALKFGLLAETAAQLNDLSELVSKSGHQVMYATQASKGALEQVPDLDAWAVRLDLQHDKSALLIDKLESFEVPVIYDDIEKYAELGQSERLKRFAAKIQLCVSGSASSIDGYTKADEVWVLAASTGGPEAVCRFLKTLPEVAGVAFLYVQHLSPQTSSTLHKALMRSTTYTVLACERSRPIMEKCIYVVPPENQIELHSTGVISPLADKWLGPYQPSIDQVMGKVARNFGKRCGAIIFSGMGDDGAGSCSYMRGSGGVVWAQSPLSCAVDAMPVEAIKSGNVSYQGSPENLARQFVYGRHIPSNLFKKSS
ncbi:chemosensory pili system protein ChpB (putative protein-glutamate methylesterase) [Alteromonadaceae bacterium Bs31]|nr:chemosensory pili system protein ChpB (putative protein-glutamate methylesterase) [Alteromonadaceae bacterium Bs31]